MGSPIFKYFIFAVLATLTNLFIQYLFTMLYEGPLELWIGMGLGTIAGLLLKYVLDKFFVFQKEILSVKQESKFFFIYAYLGIYTTLFYMLVEWAFYTMFPFEEAKYIGGAIGLAGGYLIKYFLDKRFVFNS